MNLLVQKVLNILYHDASKILIIGIQNFHYFFMVLTKKTLNLIQLNKYYLKIYLKLIMHNN